MTDQDVLTEIQFALVESPDGGATVSSGLWTPTELQDAINDAQQWVMSEGRPLFQQVTLNTIPNVLRYNLPQDWMMTQRVSWESASGRKHELARDTSWSPDYAEPEWTITPPERPLTYNDSETPLPQLQVMPQASDNGILEVTYVPVPPTLSNTGVSWFIPDICIPMAKWRAIAILLAKDGRGQDEPRAKAANDLAEQGLEALKVFLSGW